jgi:hypothetical protein
VGIRLVSRTVPKMHRTKPTAADDWALFFGTGRVIVDLYLSRGEEQRSPREGEAPSEPAHSRSSDGASPSRIGSIAPA